MSAPTKAGYYWARVVNKTKKWPWSIVEIAVDPFFGSCLVVISMGTDEQNDLSDEWVQEYLEWGNEILKEAQK